jgi:hypothetical protein
LRVRIEAAMQKAGMKTVPPESYGSQLMTIAESLLGESGSAIPDRSAAITLLAADAVVTLACEWEASSLPS